MTNAEARFNNSLRPRKPEGSLGRTAQDGHLDSHTAPELGTICTEFDSREIFSTGTKLPGVCDVVGMRVLGCLLFVSFSIRSRQSN